MRLLSQSEFKRIGGDTNIPVDLVHNYFPVQLRAFAECDGTAPRESRFDRDDLKNALGSVRELLDTKHTFRVVKNYDGKDRSEDIIDEFDWDSYRFGEEPLSNESLSQVLMFPADHLLFGEKLKQLEITPEPGYLYFGASLEFRRGYHDRDLRGSVMLGEPWLDSHKEYMKRAELEDHYTLSRLKQEQALLGKKGKKGKKEPEPIEFERAVDAVRPWHGPIADVEHLTNSRLILKQSQGSLVHYLLETPFEFPRGFVRETAHVLKRRWKATSTLVEKFCDLAFSKPEPSSGSRGENRQEREFPQGEPKLIGPDIWWRDSSNPWFVQSILLARLIGGTFWQYALGNLEQNMQASIETLDGENFAEERPKRSRSK